MKKNLNVKQPINLKKIISAKGLVALIVFTLACIVPLIFSNWIWGENSIFYAFESSNLIWQEIVRKIPALIESIVIIVFAIDIFKLYRLITKRIFKNNNRALTVISLLTSLIKWAIIIIIFFIVLSAFGANTGALLASAGILTLVIGLGAQSLISDIIAGFFLVFEGEYQVGDIITVDGWRGTVIDIGIRVTRLIDAGGNIKTINNSDVKNVINQTNELSVAKVYMSIDLDESLERAELVFKNNLEEIRKKIPSIVEGPFYKGVAELKDSSIEMMFIAKCLEKDIFQVQRDMTREFYLVLAKNNIRYPFKQVTVSYRKDEEKAYSEAQAKAAQKFVDEQREKTKDIGENGGNQ